MSAAKKRLSSKICVVTGASSGIGREICLSYAQEGATVVAADINATSRDPEEADLSTVDLVKQETTQEALFKEVDVTIEQSMQSLVQDTVSRFGRLDVFVNNAGITAPAAPIWAVEKEDWSKTLDVNCNGMFYGTKAAAAQMIKQDPLPSGDRGWIINMCSTLGMKARASSAPYVSSKHLIMGLTKSAAVDCAPHRVHVNAICPGYVNTFMVKNYINRNPDTREHMSKALNSQHPFKGVGDIEDVAKIAVFLASEDASWVSGTGIVVDGASLA